jgi:hypothetical protein
MSWPLRGARTAGFAVLLGALGGGLRWATAGVLDAMSTADLESMAVLGAAAVAWSAYGWFVSATVATLLELVPGTLGRAASSVAGGISSDASRRLLRSALGVAAAAQFSVAAAHAASAIDGNGAGVHAVQQDWAPIERPSSVSIGLTRPGAAIERPSSVRLDLSARRKAAPIGVVGPRWESAPIEPPSSIRCR